MTDLQLRAALVLWREGFDSHDIASILMIGETVVVRTLQAARSVAKGRAA